MHRLLWVLPVPLLAFLPNIGCSIYASRDSGNYSAGPADPLNYPPPYLGVGGDRQKLGGSFTEIAAYAGGKQVGYFAFPFSPTQLPSFGGPACDPLKLSENGLPNKCVPVPNTYVFDPSPPMDPFPMQQQCKAPPNYMYDAQRDEVRYDEAGNVFTALPNATYTAGQLASYSYVPIVAEVPVTSNGEPCQQLNADTLLNASQQVMVGKPDSNYLLWPILETSAAVYRIGQSAKNADGVSAQHYGWYNHYIVQYLDGGYIPTVTSQNAMGQPVIHFATQTLYYPRSQVMGATTAANGKIGQGYDVLDAARADANYSPICAVLTYDAGMPAKTPAQLPKDAATVKALYGATLKPDTVPYIYCPQVR